MLPREAAVAAVLLASSRTPVPAKPDPDFFVSDRNHLEAFRNQSVTAHIVLKGAHDSLRQVSL